MPSRQNSKIDSLVQGWGVGYWQETGGLVAPLLAPATLVDKQSDLYPVFGRESWRIIDSLATPTSEIAEVDFERSTGSYFCLGHALAHDVPNLTDETPPFDQLKEAVYLINAQLQLEREKVIVDALTSATVNLDVTATWNLSTATILEDINQGVTAIRKGTGQFPDLMVMGLDVFQALQATAAPAMDKVKYTSAGPFTEEILSGLLSPPNRRMKVAVSTEYYNSANKGATATYSALWPAGRVLLAYTGATADASYGMPVSSLYRAGFAKTLYWREAGGGKDGVFFRSFPIDLKGTHGVVRVQGTHYWTELVTSTDAYYQLDVLD